MNLWHLRHFIAVAEELDFTRTAEKLGVKPQLSSLQIRQLDSEMGTALFHYGVVPFRT